jgi:hypothetical protein
VEILWSFREKAAAVTVASRDSEGRAAYCHGEPQRRTPGPPPFLSMNSESWQCGQTAWEDIFLKNNLMQSSV